MEKRRRGGKKKKHRKTLGTQSIATNWREKIEQGFTGFSIRGSLRKDHQHGQETKSTRVGAAYRFLHSRKGKDKPAKYFPSIAGTEGGKSGEQKEKKKFRKVWVTFTDSCRGGNKSCRASRSARKKKKRQPQ